VLTLEFNGFYINVVKHEDTYFQYWVTVRLTVNYSHKYLDDDISRAPNLPVAFDIFTIYSDNP